MNVLLLPMGRGDDGAQYVNLYPETFVEANAPDVYSSTNEKLDRSNFIEGVSAFTTYAILLNFDSSVYRRNSWALTCTK